MNERGSIIGRVSGEFLMSRATEQVVDPEANLEIVRKHLKTGSAVVLFNHFKGDLFLWAKFIKDNINSLDQVAVMVAMKYLDPERGLASKALSFMFPKWEQSFGIKVLPAVQSKDFDIYPDHNRINMTSVIKVRDFLKEPGHVLAFSPEGTRSTAGELGKAEDGVGLILKVGKNTMVVPVAAEALTQTGAKLYQSKTRITVGTPFFYKDLEEDQLTHPNAKEQDLIMLRLASLLPQEKRGHYRQA